MKVLIELDVNKEKLLSQALIEEMGWVQDSGIFLSKIIEFKEGVN